MRDLAFLLWPLVCVFAIWRFAQVAERWAPGGPAVPKPEDAPIPADLLAFANQESEQWAKDEALELIRRKYIEHGHWNAVRSAVGIGSM
jgi:hypothetical protein